MRGFCDCPVGTSCRAHVMIYPLDWAYEVYCSKGHCICPNVTARKLLKLHIPYPPHGINAMGGGWSLPAVHVYERPVHEDRFRVFLTKEEEKEFACIECERDKKLLM